MTGRRGRPPVLSAEPEQQFGPWRVTATGLRIGAHRAARATCSCGRSRTWRLSELAALAGAGPECQHAGSEARPRRAPVRTRLRLVADEDIRPGAVIGGWRVIRERPYQSTRGVQLACATCGHERVSRRQVLAALAVRPCTHPPPDPPWSAERFPGQARVLDWLRENAPDRAARAAEIAAALDITPEVARAHLRALAAAGLATLLSRRAGLWGLPGVTAEPQVSKAAARIAAFLAADGGGVFSEVQAGAGLPPGYLSVYLPQLVARGTIVRLEDARGGFYLLPGQQPGEILPPPGGAPPAGRVSDRTRLQRNGAGPSIYPRPAGITRQ